MQPKWTRRLGLVGLVGAIVYASVGCAEERPAINQVQPNALSKHFFVGADLTDQTDNPQFYMRNTVVDIGQAATADQEGLFTATYAQPLSRIVWEIDENVLVARLTYDTIQGSSTQAAQAEAAGQMPPDGAGSVAVTSGQVVAMFNIESQFDIRRSYNPQTGEEYNIIVENTTDRPWYQREYMRVDWSKNLTTDNYAFDTLSEMGVFGGISWGPESYEVTDPNDPNAPAFDMATGYFDITTKAFATPNVIQTQFGTYPACWFTADFVGGGAPIANCAPTEVTLRLSFKQVVDDDYEPTDWNGNLMYSFGWFTEDRFGYDRNYGVIDQNWHRYAAKHNIWQQSHITGSQCAVDYYRDANGNVEQFKVDSNGNFLTDPTSGLPILATPGDPTAQPYPSTPVGADPNRLASDGLTAQECSFTNSSMTIVHPGAYCDVSSNKCALSLNERSLRTIPWYYGPQSDPTIFAATARALGTWNVAVKRGALIGQMTSANRLAATYPNVTTAPLITNAAGATLCDNQGACDSNGYPTEAEMFADEAPGGTNITPNVFVLCHNPVIDGDDPTCGPAGLLARVGDIRYNMTNVIPDIQNIMAGSPWGIMVDANDPLTGEKVTASVNVWGAVTQLAAQSTEDILRWINGEITDQQIVDGSYMNAWVSASKLGTGGYQPNTLSATEIQNRIAAIDTSMSKYNGLTAKDSASPRDIQYRAAQDNLGPATGTAMDSTYDSFTASLVNTGWESQMITPNNLQMAGFNPTGTPVTSGLVTQLASPLQGANPRLAKWINSMLAATTQQNGFCQVDQPEPDSLVGMARMALKLYPLPASNDPNYPALLNNRNSAMHQWIVEQFHTSVIEHEMGHSMGLRHNFTGSFDALNYKPQYWQLRTRNNAEPPCSNVFVPQTDGTVCAGPRWMDPITDAEVNGLEWKWGSTTVMDYPGDQTQDMNDIGAYDKAAMRFGYGSVVDVDSDATLANAKGQAYLGALDGFGGIGGQSIGGVHYTNYNAQYHILGTCGAPTDPNDLTTATCSGFPLEYHQIRDMIAVDQFGPQVSAILPEYHKNWAQFGTGQQGKIRHPYMFGSDEFADFGNIPVFRFDAGADNYEQLEFLITTYENRYIFNNFRRNRVNFTTLGVNNRVASRYFDKIQSIVKSFALVGSEQNNEQTALQDPGNLMPLAIGSADVLSTFIRVITRPEPGPYSLNPNGGTQAAPWVLPFGGGQSVLDQANGVAADFQLPIGSGAGHFIENDYDYSQGYWWADYQTKVGSWFEKDLATYYLTEAYNDFIFNQEQDYIDSRYLNLNFASIYPQQVRRFFTAFMAGDPMTLGPYITTPTAQLGPTVAPQVQYLDWTNYSATTPLDYPAGATVLDPLVGWERQYPGLIHLATYGSTNFSSAVHDQMRIFSPGDISTTDIPVSECRFFVDPVLGTVYAAQSFGTETINTALGYPVEMSIGARMLQYANTLAVAAYGAPLGHTPTDPYTGLQYPSWTAAQVANPVNALSAQALAGYISNIDVTKNLSILVYYPADPNQIVYPYPLGG